MAKTVDNLVSVQSVLMSGAAGVATMMIANTLWMAYRLPPRWIALALSFLLGLVAFVAARQGLGQRILCYLCSSSIIFLVAVGSDSAGVILTGLAGTAGQMAGTSRIGVKPGTSRGYVLQHLDMSARTRSGGAGRLRPKMIDGNAGTVLVSRPTPGAAPESPAPGRPHPEHGNPASLPLPGGTRTPAPAQKPSRDVSARKPGFFNKW
ncbi:MAG: hypothetical protein ACYDHM_13185 [Acidiferrobacterales bacterium]